MKIMVRYFCLLIVLVFHFCVFAVLPVVDTGALQRSGKQAIFVYGHVAYQAAYQAADQRGISSSEEAILNADLVGRLDQGLSVYKDINARYFIAVGRSGLQGGGILKWIPFPDYQHQPAIGVNVGAGYRLVNFWDRDAVVDLASHFVELYFHPLISKEFSTAKGLIVPYAALPLILQASLDGEVVNALLQFVLGVRGELFFIHFHKFELNVELSVGFAKAKSDYISLGVITQL